MKCLDLHPVRRGLAFWTGKDWRFGEEALAACRVNPLSVCSDFWERMTLTPLPRRGGRMRHRADLAVAALKAERHDFDSLAALAPAGWDRETLQVFLGAAEAAGLRVRWLLPRAAAVAGLAGGQGDVCEVWEWSWNTLHRIELRRMEGRWKPVERHRMPEGGIFTCFRREAREARDLLLEARRYDPLDSGRTEQALFASWWKALREGSPWQVSTPDGAVTDLGGERGRFAALHELHPADGSVLPAELKRLLAVGGVRTEPEDLSAATAALEEHGEKGAKWREGLETLEAASHGAA